MNIQPAMMDANAVQALNLLHRSFLNSTACPGALLSAAARWVAASGCKPALQQVGSLRYDWCEFTRGKKMAGP